MSDIESCLCVHIARTDSEFIFMCVERAFDSERQILNVASVYTLRELIVNPIFLCVERDSDSECQILNIASVYTLRELSESYLSVRRESL